MTRLPDWLAALANRRMLICVFTGFASGMPLFLLLNLLPAWLKSEGVSLKAIGLLALIQLPYTWKFLWAPLLDRYAVPHFGRRRGWMLITQVALLGAIGLLGGQSPQGLVAPTDFATTVAFATHPVALLAMCIALFSATQDIALDAYRREILLEVELGLGNAVHVNAYRLAGLVPGSLSLILADVLPWSQVFWITAAFVLPGMAMALLVTEPQVVGAPRTLRQAVVEPFHEFLTREGWRTALLVLGFMFLYKLGDSLATALSTPFYLDLGYSKTDIGLIAKHAGLWPAVIGGLIGGLWMVRLGINRALWLFGLVQLVTILGFAWLAWVGPQAEIGAAQRGSLALVIGAEYLGVGLGAAAFTAFIARATHPAYTATQFALFTSLTAVPRTVVNASAGWLVDALGWTNFFLVCTALAVPGMLLLLKVAPWNGPPAEKKAPAELLPAQRPAGLRG